MLRLLLTIIYLSCVTNVLGQRQIYRHSPDYRREYVEHCLIYLDLYDGYPDIGTVPHYSQFYSHTAAKNHFTQIEKIESIDSVVREVEQQYFDRDGNIILQTIAKVSHKTRDTLEREIRQYSYSPDKRVIHVSYTRIEIQSYNNSVDSSFSNSVYYFNNKRNRIDSVVRSYYSASLHDTEHHTDFFRYDNIGRVICISEIERKYNWEKSRNINYTSISSDSLNKAFSLSIQYKKLKLFRNSKRLIFRENKKMLGSAISSSHPFPIVRTCGLGKKSIYICGYLKHGRRGIIYNEWRRNGLPKHIQTLDDSSSYLFKGRYFLGRMRFKSKQDDETFHKQKCIIKYKNGVPKQWIDDRTHVKYNYY